VTKKATASKVTKKATASKVTKKATASKVTKKAEHSRPRLQVRYRNEATATLMEEFGYSNVMEVPRLQKMVVNIGVGEALTNGKALEGATKDLITITGQKPVITRAKKRYCGVQAQERSWYRCLRYP
jgi:large subunit ribosomal protein L5